MASNKILIVDDEFVVGLDLKERLESLGYSVVGISASSKDAIALCRKYNPDLVLMDIVIKGDTDGINTAKILKEQFNTPVIYLTAYADNRTIRDAMVTEPYGYLVKPVQERELKSAIEIAMYKLKTEKRLAEGRRVTSAITDLVPGMLFVIDPRGRFTLINSEMEGAITIQGSEARGKKAGDYIQIKTKAGIFDPVDYSRSIKDGGDLVEDGAGIIFTNREVQVSGRLITRNVRNERDTIIGAIFILWIGVES